jgi:carbonic anhydrase/acetyltransferase-like protein (isoleucine patch superfamily)
VSHGAGSGGKVGLLEVTMSVLDRGVPVVSIDGQSPMVGEEVFVDPSCRVIGAVTLEQGVSVWPLCVLRADSDRIRVGARAAILDQVLVEAPAGRPVQIGRGALISHGARLHGCTIGAGALVGIGAIVLDAAMVGAEAIVGAGSVIPPGTVIPERSLVLGLPGKVVREVTAEERRRTAAEVDEVARKATRYLEEMRG